MKRIFSAASLLFLIVLLQSVTLAGSDVLTIISKQRVDTDERIQSEVRQNFQSSISEKNLIGLNRKAPFSMPDAALASGQTITVNVCAIRVQFKFEDPDDANTTGDGHFDMRSQSQFIADEEHEIDMAPHNKRYFETHLRALNQYWHTVSKDRVELVSTVFPLSDDSVYTLDKSMSYYGSQSPFNGLADFFQDALLKADLDDDIDFSEFDAFVIIHAGADQQMNLTFSATNTLHDLYTGFIRVDSEHRAVVDGGADTIWEAVLIPEAVSQDNRVIALNGVFAHEFGHQLGLVDMYDTRTFMTQIGDFSLMDNQGRGTSAEIYFPEADRTRFVLDPLPVYPDAWSRAFLGFVEVVEVSDVNNQPVAAAELLTDEAQVIKVPISDMEYYLIENRQFDSDRDGGSGLRVDSLTGVILGPSAPNERRLTRDYDFFVPGAGIVIYHIDETRAYLDYDLNGVNNFFDNKLQWYNFYPCKVPNDLGLCIDSVWWENTRFVSLVEADGIIDFGGNYRTGFGSPDEFFVEGNNTTFGPTTNPSTRSNTGAQTGIEIYNVSRNDVIMTFDVRLRSKLDGFPKFVDGSRFPPVLADYDLDGTEDIFVSGRKHVIAMQPDGSPIIALLPGEAILDTVFVFYGDTLQGGGFIIDTLRSIASVGEGEVITTPPLVFDYNGDEISEVVVGTSSGNVYIWQLIDDDEDGRADLVEKYEGPAAVVSGPVAVSQAPLASYGALVGFADSTIHFIDFSYDMPSVVTEAYALQFAIDGGSQRSYYIGVGPDGGSALVRYPDSTIHDFGSANLISFTAADLDGTNGTDFAVLTSDGYLIILMSQSSDADDYSVNEIKVCDSLIGDVVTAALDPTVAVYQIIFAGNNKLYVYNHNGSPFENFPVDIDIHVSAGLLDADPIVADLDGDDIPDILIGTPYGELFAFGANGVMVNGFPLFAGSWRNTGSVVIPGSISNNYEGMLLTICADNRLYSLRTKSRPLDDEQSWRTSGRSATNHNFRGSSDLTPASPSGDDLIVTLYNWPNPADEATNIRYKLRSPGTINIQIFDLSGRLVYEATETSENIQKDHEWKLDGYPSGVYICRLEANSDGRKDVKSHKIAVVR
jgi:M6 family metalloprotease-like protein